MAKDKKEKNTEAIEQEEVKKGQEEAPEQTEQQTGQEQANTATAEQNKEEKQDATGAEAPDAAVEKLQQELAEAKDKYLRLYSEFENFRRRTAKEKVEFMQTANEGLIKELITILDDYDRAETTFNKEEREKDPVLEGLEIIMNKFKKTLEKQGLKEMEDAKGKAFDTEIHEAVTQFPAPSDDLKGKIIDQLEKGYYLHEKVIRYAKVVVGT